ncbi:MAG: DNA repair protein RadC [Verrucomicrobiales bacterium]|jgi:DNA repair protein RadC
MSLRIQDLPDDERPREKLAQRGAKSLTDAELIAIFLRVGSKGVNAIELGRQLLERHGSLAALARCTVQELAASKGVGPAKGAQMAAAFELGNRLAHEGVASAQLDSPERICALLGPEMRALRQESLRVVLLNTRNRLIKVVEVTRGTINESLASPREILREALIHSAYGFILVHNHPSGDPSPSAADREVTRRLKRASGEMEIEMMDHIIIGAATEVTDGYFSFKEMGMI